MNLHCESVEPLPDDTRCYQVADGTIFYFRCTIPQRLYLKSNVGFINHDGPAVTLPEGEVVRIKAHGNCLYFNTTLGKIYRATAIGFQDRIAIDFVRELGKFETINEAGLCIRNGKYIYPMSDDHNGVLIEPSDQLERGALKGIHNGKCIFVKDSNDQQWHMFLKGGIAIVITVPFNADDVQVYVSDSSTYFYISNGQYLHFINTANWQMSPAVTFKNFSNISIVGIIGVFISFTGEKNGKVFLVTAKAQALSNNSTNNSKKDTNKDGEFPRNNDSFKAVNSKMASIINVKKDWNGQCKIYETVNDLLDKNRELKRQIANLKKDQIKFPDGGMIKPFRERNEKLIRENAQIEVNNRECRESVAKAYALNEEINAANDQLNEELAIMQEGEEVEEEKLNTHRDRNRCLSEEKGKLSWDKKQILLERLKVMIFDNEKLCNSLSERSNETRTKELIDENERIMKAIYLI